MNTGIIKLKNLIATAVLMAGLLSVSAGRPFMSQSAPGNGDRIESLRIAFITQQLNLSPAEAEKFWPVYNAYKNDLRSVQQKFPEGAPLTAEQQIKLEQDKLDLKKKYMPQFQTALGVEKLNQLYNLEHKFQEKLKEIREQRMQQKGSMGNHPNGQR